MHLVASRQTGTATAILRTLLAAAGKDIRLKTDAVSIFKKNRFLFIWTFFCGSFAGWFLHQRILQVLKNNFQTSSLNVSFKHTQKKTNVTNSILFFVVKILKNTHS